MVLVCIDGSNISANSKKTIHVVIIVVAECGIGDILTLFAINVTNQC